MQAIRSIAIGIIIDNCQYACLLVSDDVMMGDLGAQHGEGMMRFVNGDQYLGG